MYRANIVESDDGCEDSLSETLLFDGYREDFARLRQYLAFPSSENWTSILQLLFYSWPSDSVEFAVDYASQHLESWSDSLRLFPPLVWDFVSAPEEFPPCYRLARALRLDCESQLDMLKVLLGPTFGVVLKYLDLSEVFSGSWCTKDLSVLEMTRELTYLNLESNYLNAQEVESIGNIAALSDLDTLTLDDNDVGNRGCEWLVSSRYLTKLETLRLCCNDIGNEGLKAIAKSESMSQLKFLDVGDNPIGFDGFNAVALSPTLKRLERL